MSANRLLILSNIKIDEYFRILIFFSLRIFRIFRGLAYIECILIHVNLSLLRFQWISHSISYSIARTNAHNHQQINDAFWFIHMELISFVSILIRCFETLLFASGFIYELDVANGNAWKTKPYRNMMNILNEHPLCWNYHFI